jgi:molybdopterin molybdotransferase
MNVITYKEAEAAALKAARPPMRWTRRALLDSIGYATCHDIHVTVPNPRFDNSAVDGYAVVSEEDSRAGAYLKVVLEVPAGHGEVPVLSPGECVRIFTGAQVDPSWFAVAMQEDVSRDGDRIVLKQEVEEGFGIRRIGSDIAVGEPLLEAGEEITDDSVALLASQGITEIDVWDKPRVSIVTTGSELSMPGEKLVRGKIYDSNSIMLRALVQQRVGVQASVTYCSDDQKQTQDTLAEMAELTDLIVVSGGASVGDHDFVPGAVSRLGKIIYHGISMRPGKPGLLGQIGDAIVFGLPGNPASTFVGFMLFALPAIRRMCGVKDPETRWFPLPFGEYAPSYYRDDFVRCEIGVDGVARPVGHQGSFGLRSLARADCLVMLPAETPTNPGDMRLTMLLR